MSRIKDENYYQISGWMLNCLELKGTELQVFAIIYGFSQDGESMFSGSLTYLCDWVGASKPTIIKALKELVSKEYIIKEPVEINNVTFSKYRANISLIADLRGSKDSLLGSKDSLLGSKDSLLNKDINNNTHTLSKDNVFETGDAHSAPESKTSSSGKLFSSAKSQTKKSSVQKTNSFITACHKEALKKEFPVEVLNQLDRYFIMLAELNCLLPAVSIAEQLTWLKKVPADKQVAVVKNTISRGWKSLQYEAEAVMTGGASRNSSFVDTSTPGTFKATPQEEKNGDWKKDIPDDHIF